MISTINSAFGSTWRLLSVRTYNYADPSNTLEHTIFDVKPYDYRLGGWGNTRDSVEGCKKACDAATDGTAKDKFKYNNEAVAYRNQIEVIIQ